MDICVSVDGSWPTGGVGSHNGIVEAISFDSGQVVGHHLMINKCVQCDKMGVWWTQTVRSIKIVLLIILKIVIEP